MSELPKNPIDVDAAIDAVAREMTNLDAPSGLRAQVLAEIDATDRRGGFALPRWAWAAGMAVIVFAVAGIVWMSRPADRPVTTVAKAGTEAVVTKPQPAPANASSQGSGASNVATNAGDGGRAGAAAAANGAATEPAANAVTETVSGPAPLAEPKPISIPELGPDAIAIAEIQVTPLGDIQPLAIKDITVGSNEPPRRQDK